MIFPTNSSFIEYKLGSGISNKNLVRVITGAGGPESGALRHKYLVKIFSENMQEFYRRAPYQSVTYVKLHTRTFRETVSSKMRPYIFCLYNKMHLKQYLLMVVFDYRKINQKQSTVSMQVAVDKLYQNRSDTFLEVLHYYHPIIKTYVAILTLILTIENNTSAVFKFSHRSNRQSSGRNIQKL